MPRRAMGVRQKGQRSRGLSESLHEPQRTGLVKEMRSRAKWVQGWDLTQLPKLQP